MSYYDNELQWNDYTVSMTSRKSEFKIHHSKPLQSLFSCLRGPFLLVYPAKLMAAMFAKWLYGITSCNYVYSDSDHSKHTQWQPADSGWCKVRHRPCSPSSSHCERGQQQARTRMEILPVQLGRHRLWFYLNWTYHNRHCCLRVDQGRCHSILRRVVRRRRSLDRPWIIGDTTCHCNCFAKTKVWRIRTAGNALFGAWCGEWLLPCRRCWGSLYRHLSGLAC